MMGSGSDAAPQFRPSFVLIVYCSCVESLKSTRCGSPRERPEQGVNTGPSSPPTRARGAQAVPQQTTLMQMYEADRVARTTIRRAVNRLREQDLVYTFFAAPGPASSGAAFWTGVGSVAALHPVSVRAVTVSAAAMRMRMMVPVRGVWC